MTASDLAAQQRYRILRGGSPPAPHKPSPLQAHYAEIEARSAAYRAAEARYQPPHITTQVAYVLVFCCLVGLVSAGMAAVITLGPVGLVLWACLFGPKD